MDYVEEFFKGCVKTLRVFRALVESDKPLSRYAIEKNALVYDSKKTLERFIELGIVKTVESAVLKYEINRENSFVKELEHFLVKVGYISK